VLEAKNSMGIITSKTKEVNTLAVKPVIKEELIADNEIEIQFLDSNALESEYLVFVDGKPVNKQGEVTSVGESVKTDENRKFTIKGLQISTDYTIVAKIVNRTVPESIFASVPLYTKTAGGPPEHYPTNIRIISSQEYADVYYDKSETATSYSVEVEEINSARIFEEIKVLGPYAKVENLEPNKPYRVRVKAINAAGETEFSPYYEFRTLISLPDTPMFDIEQELIHNNSITLGWNGSPNVYGYEIFVDGKIIDLKKQTSFTHENLSANMLHVYKIRAYNQAGTSTWSPMNTIMTVAGLPQKIGELRTKTSDTEIVMQWDKTDNAYYYDVSIGNHEFKDVKESLVRIDGLTPATEYQCKIKVYNQYGAIEAGYAAEAATDEIITKAYPTPEAFVVKGSSENVTLTWKNVIGATDYKLIITKFENGEEITINKKVPALEVLVDEGLRIQYVDTEIVANERRNYQVCALVGDDEKSDYTEVLTGIRHPELPDIPSNIVSLTAKDAIKIVWDAVNNALGYDIEIDGIKVDNGNKTVYYHDGLEVESDHMYRVRAYNSSVEGEWSGDISIKTLFGLPEKPSNISISSTKYIATIKWDGQEGEFYRVSIKDPRKAQADVIEVGTQSEFKHRNLDDGIEYTYKLLAYNGVGNSPWTGEIVQSHLKAICKRGETIDLGLTAQDVEDFDNYMLKVAFNGDMLKIEDLSAYTSKKETGIGKIDGTDIEIVALEKGLITFKVNKGIADGYAWTGVINNIKFEPVLNGGTHISYVVEKLK